MHKAVLVAVANVDKAGVNPWQYIFDCTEINVSYLVATRSNNNLLNLILGENSGNTVLFCNNNLL